MVEATVAGFVVAVSVAGLVVSICYGRQLERSTKSTWRATCAATATMEQIRADSANDWNSLPTNWNGAAGSDAGIEDALGSKLVTGVGSDDTVLDSSAGMWTTGNTAPNFYFVRITPDVTATDVAKSLVFQTYVANRGGMLNAAQAEDTTGSSYFATTGTASATTSSAKLSTADASLSISGSGNGTSVVTLKNTSSLNLLTTSLKVTLPNTVKMTYVSLNGVVLYNNPAKPLSSVTCSTLLTLPTGLIPGDIRIEVRASTGSLANATASYGFTFLDKSTKTVTVTP